MDYYFYDGDAPGFEELYAYDGDYSSSVRSQGGGTSKKRRRYQVEIDGEVFDVGSAEEAEDLIESAKVEATKRAEIALERANRAQKRPIRKVLADARKALELPEIRVNGLDGVAAKALEDIRAVYESAIQAIEISALLRKREEEEMDDEDILLLL